MIAVDLYQQRAGTLAGSILKQHAREVDTSGRFPRESIAALGSELLGMCVPEEYGGGGQGLRAFAAVSEALAQGCSSTAMVFVMHVSAVQAIAASPTLARKAGLLREIAAGRHLTTLALSEKGSRSQFWAPVSHIAQSNGQLSVSAEKSWVTSAGNADSYVASAQKPGAASPFESTLFLVRRSDPAVRVQRAFDGLGLRGNDSSPVSLQNVGVTDGDLITPQGEGAAAMLQVILPWFNIGSAAMSNGLCRAAVGATAAHLQAGAFEHTGTALRDLPTLRARVADMCVRTEQAAALLDKTISILEREAGPAPAPTTVEGPLFVLLTRLASIEAAADVTDLAMKACGGAAFSRHMDLERVFRDARAGCVMAPTADHLREFAGRALTGLPLF
jgi:alkylation response protein AidB-like acyl-CoA dehydrogenase